MAMTTTTLDPAATEPTSEIRLRAPTESEVGAACALFAVDVGLAPAPTFKPRPAAEVPERDLEDIMRRARRRGRDSFYGAIGVVRPVFRAGVFFGYVTEKTYVKRPGRSRRRHGI